MNWISLIVLPLLLLPSLALGAVQCPLVCGDPDHASRSGESGWTTTLGYSQHADGYTCPDPPVAMGLCEACSRHVPPPPEALEAAADRAELLRALHELRHAPPRPAPPWWATWSGPLALLLLVGLLIYLRLAPVRPRRRTL